MSLTLEWIPRIEAWIRALEQRTFVALEMVAVEASMTFDRLTYDQARSLPFRPISPGERWGRMWEYAWLKGKFVIPEAALGKEIVLKIGEVTPQWSNTDSLGEWRVFLNGKEIGSRDWAHVYLPVSTHAKTAEVFELVAEAFGGPTRRGAGGGPSLPGTSAILVVEEFQKVMPAIRLGIWHEDVYQLLMDAKTLHSLRPSLAEDSLRLDEVDAGLRDLTLIADPELPYPEFKQTVGKARERLRPLLECRNGSTAPVMHCIGHSHLDVVYQWPLEETKRKVARTFSNQLRLMESYPEYKFLQSMPVLYEICKSEHPKIYSRVCDAVARGQWLPEGGMWTEADTNLPGGESLIRQFLYGREFFREEFGVESVFSWLPDAFGYSGALPQIMAGCGMKYFSSSKVYWLYNGGDPFPYTSFWWEGIDGSRVLTHFVSGYSAVPMPAEIVRIWKQQPQKDGIRSRMVFYGHGDGGGGCEREHLEYLRRESDLEGMPRTLHSTPADFFKDLEKDTAKFPVYAGEIYFAAHRGVYTSQAKLKRWNRRSEFILREAELWAAAARVLGRANYPAKELKAEWKKTLFNQFHDILPGSCIKRGADEAEALYEETYSATNDLATKALNSLVEASSSRWVGFNSLPWDRTELIPLPEAMKSTEHQMIKGVRYAEVALPSCGWSELSPISLQESSLKFSGKTIENDLIRLELNENGEITSFFDKVSDREIASAPLNQFRMFRDTPHFCEAWDIDSHYELQPVPLEDPAEVALVSSGPLAVVFRIRRKIHNSFLDQEIWIRRGSARVDFRTRVEWREKHKLLKVCFPVDIHSHEAFFETQFGYIVRPTHRSRQYDKDRFEVCQQKWCALPEANRGVALLNDCKYGANIFENSMNLTLLRAPLAPDDEADLGVHEFTYALLPWNGSFAECSVIRESYNLNAPPQVVQGSATATKLFRVSAFSVVIESVKFSEDGSGDLIVRLYEASRQRIRCLLTPAFSFQRAVSTNLVEEGSSPLPTTAEGILLDFRPFEIKTIRITV